MFDGNVITFDAKKNFTYIKPLPKMDADSFVFAVCIGEKIRIFAEALKHYYDNSSYILDGISVSEALLEESAAKIL